jgi:hypothetical protein
MVPLLFKDPVRPLDLFGLKLIGVACLKRTFRVRSIDMTSVSD